MRDYDHGADMAQVDDCVAELSSAPRPDDVKFPEHISLVMFDRADRHLAQVTAASAELAGLTLACKKGCNYCCTILVTAENGEAQAAARYIVATQGVDVLRHIQGRLRIAREKLLRLARTYTDPITLAHAYGQQGIWCPFMDLRNKTCLIYPVRPLSCRTWHSLDAEACRTAQARNIQGDFNTRIPQSRPIVYTGNMLNQTFQVAYRRLVVNGPLSKRLIDHYFLTRVHRFFKTAGILSRQHKPKKQRIITPTV